LSFCWLEKKIKKKFIIIIITTSFNLLDNFVQMFLHQFQLLLLFLQLHPKSYLNVDQMPTGRRNYHIYTILVFCFLTWRRPRNSRSLRILTQTFSSRLNRTRSSGSSTDVPVVVAAVYIHLKTKYRSNKKKKRVFK
jgi:hypothetical protein